MGGSVGVVVSGLGWGIGYGLMIDEALVQEG